MTNAVRRLGRLASHLLESASCAASDVNGDVEKYYDAEWQAYRDAGVKTAMELGNRGPMRFGPDGKLAPDILEAYNRTGFYVFENVISKEEVADMISEFDGLLDNAPAKKGSNVDKHGNPVRIPTGYYGVTKQGSVAGLQHHLMYMETGLRVYAHPDILRMVESICGPDFVPFNEGILHKPAGNGLPTAWHQDGRTHWDLANNGVAMEYVDEKGLPAGKRHGFNLSISAATVTPENGLWVVPGSHKQWCLAKGDPVHHAFGATGNFPKSGARIPGAVPCMLKPGDLGLTNRSSLHGSFANRSTERRVTFLCGYHNRESAVNTETTNVHAFLQGGKEKRVKYTEEHVLRRARMIPLAIDARRQRYPEETPYAYKGAYIGDATWSEKTRAEISQEGREYWQWTMTL